MSYQVLARKWRPHHFKDVVGQPHVLTALENALEHNRLHHAYLFSGTRGVGKTTIARLFAKGLNCEQGITATPCGECGTCREIDEGRFVDLLEIDAASRTKVEDTRELLDNVQYKPARGRFKVYLIDEVHMLSRHSFNALLKTLEEPPEYVKFLLATTDPQKLPVTILSRCLQFHLKHISVDQIHTQLDHVLEHENVTADARAVSLLSHAADGSMRDALSLTDQAIALGNGQVSDDIVSTMLGTLDTDQAIRLLESMTAKDPQQAMACLAELAQVGIEWDALAKELAAQLHRIAMYQALPASLDLSLPDAERIELLSKQLDPQDVQLCYQIALQGRKDLPFAPDGKTGVEMMLLRMLAFRPMAMPAHQPQVVNVPAAEPAHIAAAPAPTQQQMNPQSVTQAQPPQGGMRQPSSAPSRMMPSQMQSAPQESPVQPRGLSQAKQAMQQQDSMQQQAPQPMSPPPMNHSGSVEPAPQAAPQPMNTAAAPREAKVDSPASNLLAARNQLRSRSKGLTPATEAKPSDNVKKINAAPAKKASSVLDRLAEKHPTSRGMQPSHHITEPGQPADVIEDDGYRWKPTTQVEDKPVIQVTPSKEKQALEQEKTPEMVAKLTLEAAEQDAWSALVGKLKVPKLIQQLALNSAFEQNGQQVQLCLRSAQAHLNSERAQAQLAVELGALLGSEIQLNIELGEKGVTPLEWRENLYQKKLVQAQRSLQSDPNVAFIVQRFSAAVDEESIRPI